MKHSLQTILLAVLFLTVLPNSAFAQSSIPISGADESLSQYICITIPGVSTLGMKVIKANGTISDITVKGAKAQIQNQIQALTQKILNVSDLLKVATTKKQKDKLKAKLQVLRSKRESVKFIKTQIVLCEKAELEFSIPTVPVLLTNTVSNPVFVEPLNHFMMGFKFTIPKNYSGTTYCVAVSNATSTPNNMGGILYPDPGETETEVYKNCQEFGAPVGQLCVNGLEDDEGLILLTQGAFVERVGDCSNLSSCSLNNFRNLLTSHYAMTRLASFRAGSCD